jgi:hypothetical protein
MKKSHYVGKIKDKDLKEKIRKPLPPPSKTHKSKKDYKRKNKHKNEFE